jgi:CBS-domain-containing membrane protein
MRRFAVRRHTVGDVMTSPAISVAESATYHDIIDTMVVHNISAVPVVDAKEPVVGVVSEADLLHKMVFAGRDPAHRLMERKRVRDGKRKAAAIRPTASIAVATALTSEHGIKRLPVVDGEDRLIGVVSRADSSVSTSRPDDQILSDIREYVFRRTPTMDPDALTIRVDNGWRVSLAPSTVAVRSTSLSCWSRRCWASSRSPTA